MILTINKEWHGFISEEAKVKTYKKMQTKNMLYIILQDIPQLLFSSLKDIDLHILIKILEIPVAIISNIAEMGVNVIYPANCQNEAQAIGGMALLGHETELCNYSLELLTS